MESSTESDWQRLQDVWYRRSCINQMTWHDANARLQSPLIAACSNGGPIAIICNNRAFQTSRASDFSELQIFTSYGTSVAKCRWTYDNLVTMHWTSDEQLLCIFQDGVARVYSVFCDIVSCYHIDPRLSKENIGVLSSVVSNDGIIVLLTTTLKLFANLSFTRPKCVCLADINITSPPLAMRILPADASTLQAASVQHQRSGVVVLVATESGPLIVVDQLRSIELPIATGPFHLLVSSPLDRHVAAITKKGAIEVYSMSSDFSTPIDKAAMRISGQPRQVCWVGEDCLAYHVIVPKPTGDQENLVLVGGPNDDWVPYNFGTSSIYLVSEKDGLRVIGTTSSFFIHRVPKSVSDIFGVGSCSPAAMLLYASDKYAAQDASVNVIMKSVLPDLPKALALCIDAAENEIETKRIRALLEAVAFGRLFLRDHLEEKNDLQVVSTFEFKDEAANDSKQMQIDETFLNELQRLKNQVSCQYVKAIRDIRVVMALKSHPSEMALTVNQCRSLGSVCLLRILSQRRSHLLALRIGEWLGLGTKRRILKVFDVISEDCSEELKDICSNFWSPYGLHPISDLSGASMDVTRPAGVSLVFNNPISGKHSFSRGPAVTLCASTSKESQPSPLCFVLEHWAKEKIASSPEVSDQDLLRMISEVFRSYPRLLPQIVQVALWAARLSRPNLATLLLQFEPRSRVQVRLLLRLGELDLAIKQSVLSGDTDLITECLMSINATEKESKLSTIFEQFPVLKDFYTIICIRSNKLDHLQKFHERSSDIIEAAWDCIYQTINEKNLEKIKELIAYASGFFASARQTGSKEYKISQQICLDHLDLLSIQKQLEKASASQHWKKAPCQLQNLSLMKTILELYIRGQTQDVQMMQKHFNISKKRLLKLQIDALLINELPEEVISLAQQKVNQQLVGGVEYFIKRLHQSGYSSTASKLLPSLQKTSNLERVWFARLYPKSEPASNVSSQPTGLVAAANSLMDSLAGAFNRF